MSRGETALLLQLLLFLLAPIAVYCLFLATLNRRLRPLLVRGHWDFVGLLFAGSGFALVVVPGLIVNFYMRSVRQAAIEGGATSVSEAIHELWTEWWWVWILYYLGLIIGAVAVLAWRTKKTLIYNIHPEQFERALAAVIEHRGLDGARIAGRWTVRESQDELAVADLANAPASAPPRASTGSRGAVFDVEAFPSMAHITLHWRDHDPLLRDEIELALTRRLQEVATYENPAATWFLGVSGFLFGLLFLIVLVLILNEFFPARRR